MAAFLRYLDVKRQNAVWGDDPEVQALCEIYDRPAEIWAYDPQVMKNINKDKKKVRPSRRPIGSQMSCAHELHALVLPRGALPV